MSVKDWDYPSHVNEFWSHVGSPLNCIIISLSALILQRVTRELLCCSYFFSSPCGTDIGAKITNFLTPIYEIIWIIETSVNTLIIPVECIDQTIKKKHDVPVLLEKYIWRKDIRILFPFIPGNNHSLPPAIHSSTASFASLFQTPTPTQVLHL